MKQVQTHQHRINLWLPRGDGWERDGLGVWDGRCRLLYILTEGVDNNVVLCTTGNYIQYPIISHNGKEYEKECVYIYV